MRANLQYSNDGIAQYNVELVLAPLHYDSVQVYIYILIQLKTSKENRRASRAYGLCTHNSTFSVLYNQQLEFNLFDCIVLKQHEIYIAIFINSDIKFLFFCVCST